jgi:nucleotide-binding universal stress UspA family protein
MAIGLTVPETRSAVVEGAAGFARVLDGLAASAASVEAARQAARLATGPVTLLAAWPFEPDLLLPEDGECPRDAAALAVHAVRRAVPELLWARERIVRGAAARVLLREVEHEGKTLVAVGSHGGGRVRGLLLGSTATEVIHRARCSVLVARPAAGDVPRRIVVGVDGSAASASAFVTARYLADRFDAQLWPVIAHGGKTVDTARAERIVGPRHDALPDEPVRALVAASADADLTVVGSRGLHGLHALGSVSERVAHDARSSVLIVRDPLLHDLAVDDG